MKIIYATLLLAVGSVCCFAQGGKTAVDIILKGTGPGLGKNLVKNVPGTSTIGRTTVSAAEMTRRQLRLNSVSPSVGENYFKNSSVLNVVPAPPGFYSDFSAALNEYATSHPGVNPRAAFTRRLQELYGADNRFAGLSKQSFMDVKNLEAQAASLDYVSAEAAVNRAFGAGAAKGPGFVLVAVQGRHRALRDILLLDLPNNRWISVYKSRGSVFAKQYPLLKKTWETANPELKDRLDRQGFVVQGDSYSKDGVYWQNGVPADLREAWQNGWFVQFEHGSYKPSGFGLKKGDALFSDAGGAFMAKEAVERGIAYAVENGQFRMASAVAPKSVRQARPVDYTRVEELLSRAEPPEDAYPVFKYAQSKEKTLEALREVRAFRGGPVEQERQAALNAGIRESSFREIKNEPPDYMSAVKGTKVIYVAEGINHYTVSARREMIRVLEAVRKENPSANILLAVELLARRRPEAPRLRKAGENIETLRFSPEYAGVLEASDRLGMDCLALDDTVANVSRTPEGTVYMFRVGNNMVVAREAELINHSPLETFGVLASSEWGLRERNKQWVRRILAVREEYDVIIVLAGADHLQHTSASDLPALLDLPHNMIKLQSFEKLPSELEEGYEKLRLNARGQGFVCAEEDGACRQLQMISEEFGVPDPQIILSMRQDAAHPIVVYTDGKGLAEAKAEKGVPSSSRQPGVTVEVLLPAK